MVVAAEAATVKLRGRHHTLGVTVVPRGRHHQRAACLDPDAAGKLALLAIPNPPSSSPQGVEQDPLGDPGQSGSSGAAVFAGVPDRP